MRNTADAAALLLAAWPAGLVVVSPNVCLHSEELHRILSHSRARVVFPAADLLESVAELQDQCPDLGGVVESAARGCQWAARWGWQRAGRIA